MPSIIAIPAFNDNYIWLIREQALAAVVDPGDAAPVLAYLAQEHLALAAIVTTHHHADHVGGNLALLAQHRVPVFAPAHEAIPGATRTLVEGDRIDVPGVDVALDVLDVPGHTAGHIAYVGDIDGPVLFCGDTLFAAGCGRLFEGTAGEMWSSLGKFARLDAETRKRARGVPSVPSTIALELATNPFLRAREPAVRKAAEAHAGTPLPRDVDVFAALRGWKNAFRG